MAGASISITYDFKELRGALDQLKERSADAKPAWRDIGEYLLNSHRERFLQQVDPEGNPWEALNPEYKKRKKKNRDKVLILDGYLRDTLRYRRTADQRGARDQSHLWRHASVWGRGSRHPRASIPGCFG